MINVINHPRKPVAFGDYAGLAGVSEADGLLTISFPGRRKHYRELLVGTVDGQAVTVIAVEDSATIKGAVLITAKSAAI